MLDYLSYFNYLTSKLNITDLNNLQFIRNSLIILIAMLGCLLFIKGVFSSATIFNGIITITGIMLIILSVIVIHPSGKAVKNLETQYRKNGSYNTSMQKKLKEYNISENVTINNLFTAHDIYNNLPLYKKSKPIDTDKFNEYTLQATLEYMNIKSINNFALNIIYLNDYYNNHLTLDNKYDWINTKLNEFYKANNNTTSDDEILKNLKN